jgi:SAM-dependent methyltransferase
VTVDGNPFNYRYFIGHAARLGGRVLDYGCGLGQMIALGHASDLDIWGADTFQGYYSAWSDGLHSEVRDRVRRIEGGQADFPDGHFDVVVSNQVLEHVPDPEASIADIHRLLRPGGTAIAAFPVKDTWYEGHVGLYFAHRLAKGSSLRDSYFRLARNFGFGLYHPDVTPAAWARLSARTLDDVCFYYPRKRLRLSFEKTFGAPVEDLAVDYMRTRLGARANNFPASVDPLLRVVYHKRAGEILKVHKPAE